MYSTLITNVKYSIHGNIPCFKFINLNYFILFCMETLVNALEFYVLLAFAILCIEALLTTTCQHLIHEHFEVL
jgi:hypothetical protein